MFLEKDNLSISKKKVYPKARSYKLSFCVFLRVIRIYERSKGKALFMFFNCNTKMQPK